MVILCRSSGSGSPASEATIIRRIQSAAKKREKADTAKREATETCAATARKRRKRAYRSPGSLLRPVFPARAFTTCWGSDPRHSRVEVAFARDGYFEPVSAFLLLLSH
jgi:hypothetical protein